MEGKIIKILYKILGINNKNKYGEKKYKQLYFILNVFHGLSTILFLPALFGFLSCIFFIPSCIAVIYFFIVGEKIDPEFLGIAGSGICSLLFICSSIIHEKINDIIYREFDKYFEGFQKPDYILVGK